MQNGPISHHRDGLRIRVHLGDYERGPFSGSGLSRGVHLDPDGEQYLSRHRHHLGHRSHLLSPRLIRPRTHLL